MIVKNIFMRPVLLTVFEGACVSQLYLLRVDVKRI